MPELGLCLKGIAHMGDPWQESRGQLGRLEYDAPALVESDRQCVD